MPRSLKNKDSIIFTPEMKVEARQRISEGQTTAQIKKAMPLIKNGQQLRGLRAEVQRDEVIKAKIRAAEQAAVVNAQRSEAPKPLSIVDRTPEPTPTTSQNATGAGTPYTFQSSQAQPSNMANMTAPRTGGKISAWRKYPVDMAGFFGDVPYPYDAANLGRAGGWGTYAVKIVHPTGAQQEFEEVIPESFGPPHNPRYHSEANMMPAPQQNDPASSIKATVEVVKAINEMSGQKKDGAVEAATARMIDAQTASLTKPEAKGADPVADFLAIEKARQLSRDQDERNYRDRLKAESEQRIIEMDKANALASSRQQEFFKNLMDLQDKKYDASLKPLQKELADAKEALDGVDDVIDKKLTEERKRDAALNQANFNLLDQQGKNLVELSKVQADLIKAQAASNDSTFQEIIKQVQPIVKDIVDAGIKRAAIDNPEGAKGAAAAMAAANGSAPAGGAPVQDAAESMVNTPEFKAFMQDYTDSAETYLEWQDEIELAAKNNAPAPDHAGKYVCDSLSFKVASLALGGVTASRILWTQVVEFVGKRKWQKMRLLIGPRLTEEQKKVVDDPRHRLFYETFRLNVTRTIATDFSTMNKNTVLEEKAYAPDPVQHAAPAAEPAEEKTEEATA